MCSMRASMLPRRSQSDRLMAFAVTLQDRGRGMEGDPTAGGHKRAREDAEELDVRRASDGVDSSIRAESGHTCGESADAAANRRVPPHFLGKGERYNIAMDIWLAVAGMTLLEEEEMPEFVSSPSSYVAIRNVLLEKWHADCSSEYTEEQAQRDAPRVFHHPAAQRYLFSTESSLEQCSSMSFASCRAHACMHAPSHTCPSVETGWRCSVSTLSWRRTDTSIPASTRDDSHQPRRQPIARQRASIVTRAPSVMAALCRRRLARPESAWLSSERESAGYLQRGSSRPSATTWWWWRLVNASGAASDPRCGGRVGKAASIAAP